MHHSHSPTLRLRRLATELKQGREQAKLNVTQAGQALGWTASKISKIETTETKRISSADLDKMMDLYKITDPDKRRAMHALARDAKERGWWSKYREVFGDQALPDFEAEASVIRCFEGLVIPGLLQTPEYAEALFQGGRYTGPEDIERRVQARIARREILTKFDPVRLRVVMDEAALRRMIGGPQIMAAQLRHLLYMAELPNVDIQVLPFDAGSHAALAAPFSILEFSDPINPPIVHVDTITDSVFFEQPGDVERYNATFGDIQGAAISTSQAARFIDDLAKTLESAS
ncbi:helix-turn-helix domain-containing protein [Streptomonospora sp. PA3]|uniref:helix-turn-helix domain-containing protein n=1 Tax=Streptomonospora sp. PA3 TaxID=2607326 RepID=UPI0012DCA9CD|nr:helix-turn-helix transcriptional regulator [Streptomonospora sp. PA3]MUL41387.1 helix-turn-helix domain-containing protein [Streptomonospora sp. PA3]